MKSETAITVATDDPKEQKQPDEAFDICVGALSGSIEPSGEDSEESGDESDPGLRFEPVNVTPDNYESVLREKWKPRVKVTVRNFLSDDVNETLAVDFQPRRRAAHWPAELDEQIPEIRDALALIEELDNLQSDLASRSSITKRLARLIEVATDDN